MRGLDSLSYFAQAQDNLGAAQTQLMNSVGNNFLGGTDKAISTMQAAFSWQNAKTLFSWALALVRIENDMNKKEKLSEIKKLGRNDNVNIC